MRGIEIETASTERYQGLSIRLRDRTSMDLLNIAAIRQSVRPPESWEVHMKFLVRN